jgi:hypothetical protein
MSTKKLILLNTDGSVQSTVDGFNTSLYTPDTYREVSTIVVDQNLNDIEISYGARNFIDTDLNENQTTTTATKTVYVNPLTEQVLSGSIFGNFQLNEQIVQSTITSTVVNGYSEGGVTLDTFLPSIGTIGVSGEIGQRSAQFKGTLNDLAAQKACGIQLPAFATSNTVSPYFLLEGWIYFETDPSNNYDPIIVTRSADGINNSTNDSFRLEYDSASDQIQFHYSTSTYASAGYQGIVNVSPSGVTTNTWNHFAIAWASRGGSASIKTYWNGTSLYSAAGLSGSIRNSTAPVMIGSGASGDYPLKGWLEDIHLRMGGVTLALADYALLGSTAAVEWQHDGPGDYTVYQLTMNGPFGSSLFPVRNLCRVSGTVTFKDIANGVIGAGLITREDSDVLGLTLFDGVCGGFSVSGGSAAYVFGADSGSCMIVSSVQQLYGITAARTIRQNAADHTNYYLFGVTVMYGQSGASGDFPKLLSSGWTANGLSFSFLPIQSNINWLRNIYDNIVVAGYTGNTTIENYYGTPYVFGPTHAKKLYEDVVTYQATANTLKSQLVSQITSASTITALNQVKGHTAAILLKLAPSAGKNPMIYISPKAKESGTGVPESKNLPKGAYLPLDDDELGSAL